MKSPADIIMEALKPAEGDGEAMLKLFNTMMELPLEAWIPMDYHAKRAAWLAGNEVK